VSRSRIHPIPMIPVRMGNMKASLKEDWSVITPIMYGARPPMVKAIEL